MKILQLLISKKHEKEENDKKKEEYLIKNFKKAINNIEIDVFSEKNLLKENKTKNVSNQEKVEEKIIMNENNKNQNEVNNELIFNSNINKINNDKVYVKNTKKIPYRKLKINSNKKNENKIKENKDEFHIENSSQINRYKNIKNIYSYYIYNTNPSSNEIIENKKQQTPYNDYVESLQQISQRNKRKIYNREDHSMILPKNAFNSIENSFDITTVYKKRNIHNKNLMGNNSPLSSKIYSYKKPINKRKNSYEKYDPNRPNNYDINEIIKNKKNNKDMFKSYLLNNYTKNYPILNKNNSNSKIDHNNFDYSTNKRNNSKKKYLYNSKTSNNFKNDKRNFINNYEIDLSNDNINFNQYNTNRKGNIIYKSYIKNINETKIFYKKNNNYNSIDYISYQQNWNNNNQSLPYINYHKNNLRNKILNNKDYECEDDDDKEEYNYINNNFVNNYINNDNRHNNYNYYNYEDGNYLENNINNQKKENNSISINIEDLMILEDKLNEIIYFLKNRKEVNTQCFDFLNFYFDSSLYQRIEQTFMEEKGVDIIKLSIKYKLLSIILCYEFSFYKKVLNKAYILMLEVLELNHRNLMIICENILNKITFEKENIYVLKLKEIVENFQEENKYYENEIYSQKIIYNTDRISKKIRNILLNYKTDFSPLIMTLLKKINKKNYEEINDFFREYILRMENIKKPLNKSEFMKNQSYEPRPPYILSPREKPYTLVLGLDETLANFQQINYTQGVLKLRPYLIEFLENLGIYYELILFTSKTQYYAEPIIRAIEQKKKYFDFIFYRENCIYVQNDLVKDLTRIGRPLDSIIIVDNMPQYFKLQKENGINIKSFWAQEPNDRALYDLIPILINIAREEIDVRDGLIKYRNEINRKVTSNISQNYI